MFVYFKLNHWTFIGTYTKPKPLSGTMGRTMWRLQLWYALNLLFLLHVQNLIWFYIYIHAYYWSCILIIYTVIWFLSYVLFQYNIFNKILVHNICHSYNLRVLIIRSLMNSVHCHFSNISTQVCQGSGKLE